tara:strand:- start:2428 stop:2628 length:201 start_codon:yes stop_codon:yes gene_type:complete
MSGIKLFDTLVNAKRYAYKNGGGKKQYIVRSNLLSSVMLIDCDIFENKEGFFQENRDQMEIVYVYE